MEPLYRTETTMTYREYKKFCAAIYIKMNRIHLLVAGIAALLGAGSLLLAERVLLLLAVLTPAIFYFVAIYEIRKTYRINCQAQGDEISMAFYGTYFEQSGSMGEARIEYADLYRIVETGTNFYFMVAKNRGSVIVKERCEPELITFIRGLRQEKQ